MFAFDENHPLGYPISDLSSEVTASTSTQYRFQRFEGGSLNWHSSGPRSDRVFEVHGAIYEKWGELGYADWEGGLPVRDERNVFAGGQGRVSEFERGHILWQTNAPAAYATRGAIDELYVSMGGPTGWPNWLGFPVSDEYVAATGYERSDFENGYITTEDGVTFQAYRSTGTCNYTLSRSSVSVDAGGTWLGSLRVQVDRGCPLTVESDSDWINIFLSGLGAVVYSVDRNTDTATRVGTLRIGAQVFTVTQAGAAPSR